jgi:hypothetical protein
VLFPTPVFPTNEINSFLIIKCNFQLLFGTSFAIATFFTSCQKQPTASFTTDKNEYVAGETIKLTSTSLEANSYKWTLPDGTTLTSKDVDFNLSPNRDNSSLSFKLEVFSKNGKKSSDASKTVYVKAAKGDVLFWNKYATNYPIGVAIGNETKTISKDYSSSPSNCNATGCANFNLKVGTHQYYAIDSEGSEWQGTVTITKDGCLKMELMD